ncbi:MAG: ubiquinol oxidase subunit II [Xanthobacteraceae bacterium]
MDQPPFVTSPQYAPAERISVVANENLTGQSKSTTLLGRGSIPASVPDGSDCFLGNGSSVRFFISPTRLEGAKIVSAKSGFDRFGLAATLAIEKRVRRGSAGGIKARRQFQLLSFGTRLLRPVLWLGLALMVAGCGLTEAPVLDPKGPITLVERDLLLTAFGLMLIVVIPVFVMASIFVWWYRPVSRHDIYDPDWGYSVWMDALVWLVPAAIVVAIGTLVWDYTHRLDPYKPIASSKSPLEVQVVGQDWKWLFLYPEQNIATVNELVFPSGRPLTLKITSDTVMNSFMIPALGGQIYAMAGMETRLNLLADEPGQFAGRNMQYSGSGFANQHFTAIATSDQDFEAWVAKARQSGKTLDNAAYEQLAKPSQLHPVTYYAAFEPNLFARIIAKYAPAGTGTMHGAQAKAASN